MSVADKFLKRKREEQRNGVSFEMKILAPSMNERHGLGGNNDGMGSRTLSSGQYTGKGPDGIVQPQLPTQRRIDTNGSPYMVDEHELLVNDAQTLEDYGGAEALDRFIQENRPSRQQPMAQPQVQQAPQQAPQAPQQGTRVRQYYGGGIPANRSYGVSSAPAGSAASMPDMTRDRSIPSREQMRMLSEVKNGIEQYQEGGTPSNRAPANESPASRFTTPTRPPRPDVTNPFQTQTPHDTPIGTKITDTGVGAKTIPFGPPEKKISTMPVQKTQGDVAPDINIPTMDFTTPVNVPIEGTTLPVDVAPDINVPVEGTILPVGQQAPDITVPVEGMTLPIEGQEEIPPPTGSPVLSQSQLDEMVLNRYLSRMGAMGESQRAAEAQRMLQAGMSPNEVMGRLAISDVGRREAEAEVTAEFAMDAAKRAEERDKFQQQMSTQQSQWEQEYELKKESLGLSKDQFMYDKNMSALGMALQNGDFKGAEAIWDKLFPGIESDFSGPKFNQGWNNMTQLAGSGMSWEDALKIMDKDGTIENLGMTSSDAEEIFKNIQINNDPLYSQKKMLDNYVKSGDMTQQEADDIWATMLYLNTHPEGLEIKHGFQVTDANGNEVGFFNTQEEADKFISDNPNKNYTSTSKTKVSLTGSDSSTTLTPKEKFELFSDKYIPKEYLDSVTYDDWVAAGKPETWEEYIDVMKTDSFSDKYDHELAHLYDKADKKIILAAIKAGNKDIIDTYYYEGDDVEDFVSEATLMDENFDESKVKIYDEPIPTIGDHNGKFTEIDGKKYIIVSTRIGKSANHDSVKFNVQDPETGEIKTYIRYYKKG